MDDDLLHAAVEAARHLRRTECHPQSDALMVHAARRDLDIALRRVEKRPAMRLTRPRRASDRNPAKMKRADHLRLWRLVEGAVVDAFACHPEYLTKAGRMTAIASLTKRIVGQLVGHAHETRKGGGLGHCSPPAFLIGVAVSAPLAKNGAEEGASMGSRAPSIPRRTVVRRRKPPSQPQDPAP